MSVPRAVVCLPTYNERENLEEMIRALAHQDVDVLVIDDSSPDGTGEIADRLPGGRPGGGGGDPRRAGGRAAVGRGAAPASQGGTGTRLRRRVPARARKGSRAR